VTYTVGSSVGPETGEEDGTFDCGAAVGVTRIGVGGLDAMANVEGSRVGAFVGDAKIDGADDGLYVIGLLVGLVEVRRLEGSRVVGVTVGVTDGGSDVGITEGEEDGGKVVGTSDGTLVGDELIGAIDGGQVGSSVGGAVEGSGVGDFEGASVVGF